MDPGPEPLVVLAQRVIETPLVRNMGFAVLLYTALTLAIVLAERRAGVDLARYRSRNFVNDVVYTLFYRGGIYGVFVLAALTGALEPHVASLRLNLLQGLPWPVALAVFWIGADFVLYWFHRLQHSNRFLWALHSVHHSQQQLNLLTAWRRHPLDTLMSNVIILYGVFHLVLGIPAREWLPLAAVITLLTAIQHAQLDWRFGFLQRVVVSPWFHSFHHSTDPAHRNANYGQILSLWDYLFGTAVPAQARPTRFGIDGIDYRESLVSQVLTPLRLMWRWRRPAAPAGANAMEAVDGAAVRHHRGT